MNRGKGKQDIFHNPQYFSSFLDCLSEANQKFGAIIHAYCLMTNHYHLILETTNANLSRIMRHINGVYTQRYNRLKKTDGPLFRGRFKSILIDEDNYLLNLNRYIHRNPIKLVKNLEDYHWSSYQAYLKLSPTPQWLNKTKTLEVLEIKNNLKKYKSYIANGEDNFIQEFYSKKNTAAVMGDENFKKKLYKKVEILNSKNRDQIKNNLHDHITTEGIIKAVAKAFNVKKDSIVKRQIGQFKNNFPRKLAMYLCQIYAQNTLFQIQSEFNLSSVGAVSHAIYSVKKELKNEKYKQELKAIKSSLFVIQ